MLSTYCAQLAVCSDRLIPSSRFLRLVQQKIPAQTSPARPTTDAPTAMPTVAPVERLLLGSLVSLFDVSDVPESAPDVTVPVTAVVGFAVLEVDNVVEAELDSAVLVLEVVLELVVEVVLELDSEVVMLKNAELCWALELASRIQR